MLEPHSSYKDRLITVEGDPTTGIGDSVTCMLEDQNGLLSTPAEGESLKNINQLEEALQESETENQIPQDEFKTNPSYEGKNIAMLLFSSCKDI